MSKHKPDLIITRRVALFISHNSIFVVRIGAMAQRKDLAGQQRFTRPSMSEPSPGSQFQLVGLPFHCNTGRATIVAGL